MSAVKKTVAAGLAALTLGTATIASSSPAEAWWRYGWGAPVAAGVLGGLAAGAIIGSAARPYGYGPGLTTPAAASTGRGRRGASRGLLRPGTDPARHPETRRRHLAGGVQTTVSLST